MQNPGCTLPGFQIAWSLLITEDEDTAVNRERWKEGREKTAIRNCRGSVYASKVFHLSEANKRYTRASTGRPSLAPSFPRLVAQHLLLYALPVSWLTHPVGDVTVSFSRQFDTVWNHWKRLNERLACGRVYVRLSWLC